MEIPFLITFVISAISFIVGITIADKAEKESNISMYKSAKRCMFIGYFLLIIIFGIALAELFKISDS